MTEYQKEILFQIIPEDIWSERYCPTLSDDLKNAADIVYLQDHAADFIKIWFQLLLSNSGTYIRAYLMQMLLLVIRERCEPMERPVGCAFESASKKYVVEQIMNYIEDHYSEKISLDQIAENMYLSPFYISRIFKNETGNAPIRHLINIRLEKAKELLEGGYEGSIQEVAARVGYDDAYHFSKLFKKRYGISPSQARRSG